MNQQDKSFLITFTTVMAVLVLIAIVIFMLSQLVSVVAIEYDASSRQRITAEERIKPVGQVAIASVSQSSTETTTKAAAAPAPVSAPTPAVPAAAAEVTAEVDLAKGEEVYSSACMACHATGAAGAPMLNDKTVWEPRAAQGMETLVSHAVNGFKAMPAKGGNPTLTESDIRNSIAYMLAEVGIEIAEPVKEAATPPAPTSQETVSASTPEAPTGAATSLLSPEETAEVAKLAGIAAEETASVAQKAAQAAKAAQEAAETAQKAAETAQKAAETAQKAAKAVAAEQEAAPEPTPPPETVPTEQKPPVPTPEATLVEQETAISATSTPKRSPAAEGEALSSAPVTEPPAEEKPVTPSETAAAEQTVVSAAKQTMSIEHKAAPTPAQEQAVSVPESAGAAPSLANVDLERGKQIYNRVCLACHQLGVAGAPKLGDRVAWTQRIAQGFDVLVEHSLKGYKGMPPKGGHTELPDEEVTAAVGYMVSESQ